MNDADLEKSLNKIRTFALAVRDTHTAEDDAMIEALADKIGDAMNGTPPRVCFTAFFAMTLSVIDIAERRFKQKKTVN
jgi:hypothetical protein